MVVVWTDGTGSSLAGGRRAGALPRAFGAGLVVVRASLPPREDGREARRGEDDSGGDGYQVVGPAPADDTVRLAAEEAVGAGAGQVEQLAVVGSPVETLLDVVAGAQAGLLVVGNRGLNSLKGRLMGSVPADVTRRSAVDVLIVHTTG